MILTAVAIGLHRDLKHIPLSVGVFHHNPIGGQEPIGGFLLVGKGTIAPCLVEGTAYWESGGAAVLASDFGMGQTLLMRLFELAEESVEDGNGEPEPTVESRRTAMSILVGNHNGQFTQTQGLNTLTL